MHHTSLPLAFFHGSSGATIRHHRRFTSCPPPCWRSHGQRRRRRISRYHSSAVDQAAEGDSDDELRRARGGTYVDLGTIASLEDSDIAILGSNSAIAEGADAGGQSETVTASTEGTIEEWRSKHWIVLIDDESSIRLAIGDYLHSMGYSCVTACDGPMSFLETLLWSCSWSLPSEGGTDGDVNIGPGDGDNAALYDGQPQECPPWITGESNGGYREAGWRLPNCVISDIRMPGGIDGVQLLELLRRTPTTPVKAASNEKSKGKTNSRRRKRGRPKKDESPKKENAYNEKDEFELLDAIVGGKGAGTGERITTPTDQAMQYLDAVRDLVNHLEKRRSIEMCEAQRQYPNAVQQMPVILLTAKAMVSDRITGYRAGANGYLPKPFRPEELLGMVDNLMRKQERERRDYDAAAGGSDDDDSLDFLTREESEDIAAELSEIKGLLLDVKRKEDRARDRERLESLLPEAVSMFQKGERRRRMFTKDHIRSILALRFGVFRPRTNTIRTKLLAELEKKVADNPDDLLL